MLAFRRLGKSCISPKFISSVILNRTMSNSKPIVYGDEASPPVRAVMITSTLLGIDFDFHYIDLFSNQNKSEFYKKINPLQKVPSIAIDGQIITDSHAIILYLCRKIENQDLYPVDNILKSKVDQMIFFNATTLFPIDTSIYCDFVGGKWPADESKVKQWYAAVDHLELQLNKHEWLSGDKMQISDIVCSMTVSSLGIIIPLLERHIKVKEWLKKLDNMPSYEINQRGVARMTDCVEKYGPKTYTSNLPK